MIECKKLTKEYYRGDNCIRPLYDLDLEIQEGKFLALMGPSGSGKSSVARAGLFHALRSGRLTKSDSWLLATMQMN